MRVTVIKTFCNEDGISILKGRKIDIDEELVPELEAKGIIESVKPVTEKKVTKAKEEVEKDDRPRKSSSKRA